MRHEQKSTGHASDETDAAKQISKNQNKASKRILQRVLSEGNQFSAGGRFHRRFIAVIVFERVTRSALAHPEPKRSSRT